MMRKPRPFLRFLLGLTCAMQRWAWFQIPLHGANLHRPVATAEVCRRHGISGATFFKWKAKFGGIDVSDARRLKVLEDENANLKKIRRLYAEEQLHVKCRKGRKKASGTRAPFVIPQAPNQR